VVYLQRWHGWCHKNLLPERVSLGAFCVHHTTLCGWQDVKVQLLINKLDLMANSSSVLIYLSSQRMYENNAHGLYALLTFKGWNSGCVQFQWQNQAVEREMSEVLEMCQHILSVRHEYNITKAYLPGNMRIPSVLWCCFLVVLLAL